MVITSLHGIFSIVINEKNQDQLLVRAKKKGELMRIFDEKRISECRVDGFDYCVKMCKQEFAHTIIMMIKEIDYADFDKLLAEVNIASDRAFA
ncbi:hypothetical protein [Belliella aquatica]|uniref:Uncharacterized protein n=1 Tax=Belliella aquatica TaxID=1323734 RepID=A0ABQ1LYY2_9BACT|nr:hypothetical protein [Belliella aquatica]MCH7405761.1 hypothetical protein [Belliella aquatica]GGC30951.1 hypothetical protein GCM10010993_07320 [Belliella aquatica]